MTCRRPFSRQEPRLVFVAVRAGRLHSGLQAGRSRHKKKVTGSHPAADAGGSEAYFARLGRYLVARGDEVVVFTTTGDDLDSFWDGGARQRSADRCAVAKSRAGACRDA